MTARRSGRRVPVTATPSTSRSIACSFAARHETAAARVSPHDPCPQRRCEPVRFRASPPRAAAHASARRKLRFCLGDRRPSMRCSNAQYVEIARASRDRCTSSQNAVSIACSTMPRSAGGKSVRTRRPCLGPQPIARERLERARALAIEELRAAADVRAGGKRAARIVGDALQHDRRGSCRPTAPAAATTGRAPAIRANSGDPTAGASSIASAWLTMISGAIDDNACVSARASASAESGCARGTPRAYCQAKRQERIRRRGRRPALRVEAREPRRIERQARRLRGCRESARLPAAPPAGTACRRAARAVCRARRQA